MKKTIQNILFKIRNDEATAFELTLLIAICIGVSMLVAHIVATTI